MSISNRFLGGKAFGFLLSSKKTRFDPNSIDLLLSKDKIERGAVVTSSLLCDFRSAWHGAKLGKNGKAQSFENGQNGGGPQSDSRWGHDGEPLKCARMLGGPGKSESLLHNHTLRAALSPCRRRAPRVARACSVALVVDRVGAWGALGPTAAAGRAGAPDAGRESESLLRDRALRAALSPCRRRAPRVCDRAAGVCRAFESC